MKTKTKRDYRGLFAPQEPIRIRRVVPVLYVPDIKGKVPASGELRLCWKPQVVTRLGVFWLFAKPSDEGLVLESLRIGNVEALASSPIALRCFAPGCSQGLFLPTMMVGQELQFCIKDRLDIEREVEIYLERFEAVDQ